MSHPVAALRKKLHIRQDTFADSIGVLVSTLSAIENYRAPLTEEIQSRIRKVYGVDLQVPLWMSTQEEEDSPQETTSGASLRYGVILTDNKSVRWIIARLEGISHPLVFNRMLLEENGEKWENYCLYQKALTAKEADEILSLLAESDRKKANTLLKKYIREEGPICEDVGPIQLDDWIPDDWYDAWKVMESIITVPKDLPGYYEDEVSPEYY